MRRDERGAERVREGAEPHLHTGHRGWTTGTANKNPHHHQQQQTHVQRIEKMPMRAAVNDEGIQYIADKLQYWYIRWSGEGKDLPESHTRG